MAGYIATMTSPWIQCRAESNNINDYNAFIILAMAAAFPTYMQYMLLWT